MTIKTRLDLFLKLRLPALHSLDEREEQHEHVWWVTVGVTGNLVNGRIVSLPALRLALEPIIAQLAGTNLNENPHLDAATRAYPTCENMASYFAETFQQVLTGTFRDEAPTLRVGSVDVSVEELSGEQTGSARLTLG